MFGNTLDFDLDENIFSDDFLLPPNEDKIPPKAANLICNAQKGFDASNLFKQPRLPPERMQLSVLTERKNDNKHKNEKRVVQRRFPGPAGLLPEISNGSITKGNRSGVNNDLDEMLMCSQTSLSMFQEAPWTTMHSDFKAETDYTIEWIKSNATGKTLVNQKAPFLAAVIKTIECPTKKLKTPTFTLKDPTDEIQADISHELYEEHANDLTVGSVIVLRQFSVFSVKNETVHHLTITSNNLVGVYNKERRCRLDFGSEKLRRRSPSSSVASKRFNDSGRLELDALRSYAHQSVNSIGKANPNEVGSSQKNQHRDHKAAMPESKSPFSEKTESRSTLNGASASKFKFFSRPSLKSNEADELNLSLDLFSEEFSTNSKIEVKTKVSPCSQNKLLGVGEGSPPLKKSKTTLSQKFGDFKFKPRDERHGCETSDRKAGGNLIDCSQISIVSQENQEDRDILQDVFHNVDAESLFEDF